MRKSFLKTFIVLGIFSIFLCGGFNQAYSQDSYGDTDTTNLQTHQTYQQFLFKNGNKVEDRRVSGTDGTSIYYKDGSFGFLKPTANGAQRFDLYTNKDMTNKQATGLIAPAGSYTETRNNNAAATAAATAAAGDDGWFANGLQTVFATALIWASKLMGWIVSMAGYVFDKAIATSTTFPSWENSIKNAWKIIRDFTNIILVFSLLYLGIKTIYEGQGFAEKKTLAGIILAAILINFSFVFTKDIAFDLSNTVGLQVLQSVKSDPNSSYSAGLMQIVDPQKLINGQSGGALASTNTWDRLFAFAGQLLLFSAITLSLGVVFLGVSLILLYRFVIFMILIIASPLGFVSTQIPWLKKHGSMWSSQLKQQVIFFPAFTLILYIVLLICVELAKDLPSSLVVGAVGQGNSPIFDYIFKFILIMGFMIALMILPSKMGAAGAGLMDRAGNGIKQRIRKMPMRTLQRTGQVAASTTARTGRLVGGGIGNRLGLNGEKNKEALKKLQETAQGTGAAAVLARARLRTSEKLKDKTYDLRNTKLGGSLGIGKGIESYNAAVASKKKKLEERKKKEEKLFGFDKAADSEDNKDNIASASGEREIQEQETRRTEAVLKQAQIDHARSAAANNGTATAAQVQALQTARIKHDAEKKKLEDKELAVGKLKNLGDVKYLELMKKRRARMWNTMSQTERVAHEKMEAEMKKKWKLDGQSSKKKRRNNQTNPPTSPSASPPASPPTP